MEHRANLARRFYQLFCETDLVYREAAAGLGLTHSVFKILYAVWNYGDDMRCPLQEVRRRSGLGKQTVNSALRRLEGQVEEDGFGLPGAGRGKAQGRMPDGARRGAGKAHRGSDYGGGERRVLRLDGPGGGQLPGAGGKVSLRPARGGQGAERPLTGPAGIKILQEYKRQ